MTSQARIRPRVSVALLARLGSQQYALPIASVHEVLPALPIERVPQSSPFVLGVVSLREQLLPVVAAAERLEISGHQRPAEPHIVCLQVGERLVGVEFDEAVDLIELDHRESLSVEALGATGGFLAGVLEHERGIICLLNPDRLFDDEEVGELTTVSPGS